MTRWKGLGGEEEILFWKVEVSDLGGAGGRGTPN